MAETESGIASVVDYKTFRLEGDKGRAFIATSDPGLMEELYQLCRRWQDEGRDACFRYYFNRTKTPF